MHLLRDTKSINLRLGFNTLRGWIHGVIVQGSFLLGMRHAIAAPSYLVSDMKIAFGTTCALPSTLLVRSILRSIIIDMLSSPPHRILCSWVVTSSGIL
jgi:hypothetical protein